MKVSDLRDILDCLGDDDEVYVGNSVTNSIDKLVYGGMEPTFVQTTTGRKKNIHPGCNSPERELLDGIVIWVDEI